jgi:hypothetical protein
MVVINDLHDMINEKLKEANLHGLDKRDRIIIDTVLDYILKIARSKKL